MQDTEVVASSEVFHGLSACSPQLRFGIWLPRLFFLPHLPHWAMLCSSGAASGVVLPWASCLWA
jgi:hypothetical protein